MTQRPLLTVFAAVVICSPAFAQIDAQTQKLKEKTQWDVHTTEGIQTLTGTFNGISGNWLQIKDEDGVKTRIPINALVDHDDMTFFALQTAGNMMSMPGNHNRTASNPEFSDYKAQVKGRRANAVYAKAKMQMSRRLIPRHVDPVANYNPLTMPHGPAIEYGWVAQPPVPPPGSGRFLNSWYYYPRAAYVGPRIIGHLAQSH